TVHSSLALAINTTFSADSGNLYFYGPISFGGNATFLTVNGSADTYIPGNISGNGGLSKRGTGTLWLSGTNSHLGNTTIHGGNLIVQGGAALLNSGTVTLKSANATFTIGVSETIGSLQGGGTTAINSGQALTIAQTGNTTYSGSIVGAGALYLTGNGTLTLSGNSTYSGYTMMQTGTLVLAGTNAAGSGRIDQSGAGPSLLQIATTGTITNNMTVQNLLATQSATLAGGIFLGNAVMNVQSGATLTLSGSLDSDGALTKTGNGTLALNGNIPFSGGINVNSGTLIGSSTNLSGLRQNNGTVEFLQNTNGTISNSIISGTGSLIKSGSGTLRLDGTTSYLSGTTTVASGTLASSFLPNSTLILQPGAAYSPGAVNSIGIAYVGGITLNGGDLLYNLGNATSDLINSSGAAALNGPVVFEFSNLGYSAGNFTLLTGNGVSSFNTANLSYNAAGNFSVTGNFVVSGNSLLFQTTAPDDYTWDGGAGNGSWNAAANW
ncbi:MAG: autotransporter-associated beta strand repeat-containing protein, partial [Spartobacteria bacterium]